MVTPVEIVLENVKLPFPKLHDFQVKDINSSVVTDHYGYFLDLGLGKTVCSICTAVYALDQKDFYSCFVLCPESLITQWVAVVESMDLTVAAYRGTPKKREKIDKDVDFLIMSYQIFQRDYYKLKTYEKIYFIVDEATILCNSNNLLWKMLNGGVVQKTRKIPGQLKPVIEKTTYENINSGSCLLTATPINKPTDAFGLIKILTPEVYLNYSQFLRVHVEKEDHFGNPSVYSNLGLLRENLLLTATLRLVEDHIELPPIIFNTVTYDLHPKHQKLYDKLIDERILTIDGDIAVDAISANALYHWAQRIIFSPEEGGYTKDPVGFELLDGLTQAAGKFIIFNNYRGTNRKTMARYDIGGIFSEVSGPKKSNYIDDFKAGSLHGLTIQPKSGGVGLNLPMCQQAMFGELPVTPRDFSQCVGRLHRQGQEHTVIVSILVARNTIQETLFKRIMDVDDLMREVVDTSRVLRHSLSENVEVSTPKTREQLLKDLKGG